jgi:CubicO group peptidase (beta-lactamase class C family)
MLPVFFLLTLACTPDSDILDTDTTAQPDDTDTAGETGETGETGDPTDTRVTDGCDASHEAFIAALEADLAANDAPGVTAALMEDGQLTCRVALGSKAADSDEPVGLDTLFQIGSTTKMFTAVALLQKVEDGTLGLEDTLAEAYPNSEFALDETWNDAIELEHLLTHQGGFYDYVESDASSDDADLAGWHADTFFPNLWLMNDPGQFWNYANPNFTIAGLVAEHHDERSYPDVMLEDVFAPLGMSRTMQRKSEVQADGDFAEGTGYYLSGGGHAYGAVPIEDVPDPAAGRPAGVSTWSTPAQMMEMARFLIDGDAAILDDSLRQDMTREQVSLGYGTGGAYGYGVMTYPGFQASQTTYYELPLWEHGGNTSSYSSAYYIVPEQSFAVSILSSGYGTDFSGSVLAALTTLTELPDPVDPPEYEWDPERLDLHVGTYSDDYNVGTMNITRQDDTLYIEMPLLDQYGYSVEPELYTMSSDLFYVSIDGSYYDLTFIGDEDGSSSRWVRNRAFVGTRQVEQLRASATPEQVERTLKLARLPELPLHSPWAPERPDHGGR